MFSFFSNGNGSAFDHENNLYSGLVSQASLRHVPRQHCWKRFSGAGQRLWDYGTTDSMPFPLFVSPFKGEVGRSPEPSARPWPTADSEERQICTTCLVADSIGF